MSSGRNNPAAPQDIAVQAVRKRPGKTGNDAIQHWDIKIFERNDYQLNHYSDDFRHTVADLAAEENFGLPGIAYFAGTHRNEC